MAIEYQVVFVSTPGLGNLIPTVEFAQCLVNHDRRFKATILIITVPERPTVTAYTQSRAALSSSADDARLTFIHLPPVDPLTPDQYQLSLGYLSLHIEKHVPHVKHALSDIISAPDSARVAGLFVDMFTTPMIDVAADLGVPCYLFFASPATFLGFMLHMPVLDAEIETHLGESETVLTIPCFANPVPPSVLPTSALRRNLDGYSWLLYHGRRFKETKGIIVNTFQELEPFALHSLRKPEIPPIFPVGPVLDLTGPVQWNPEKTQYETIMKFLDKQPPSSVVFLCFGSQGSFGPAQIREIANGLERAQCRFLWSLRKPPKGKIDLPEEFPDPGEILPEGFLKRTAEIGMVCGMAPQVTILGHGSVGGFVSHCGWNSILESLWSGVAVAAWPVYAEQQLNAYEMVEELGLAVEMRVDYREGSEVVRSKEVERGIVRLMSDGEVRRKVKAMKDKCRTAVVENGSAFVALGLLIQELAAEV